MTLDHETSNQRRVTPSRANDRRDERRWLAEQSRQYTGQWVVLDGNRLVAHGPDLPNVSAAAQAAGVDQPLTGTHSDSGRRRVTIRGLMGHASAFVRKNVLSHGGWLDRIRLGVVHHDQEIYLAPFDSDID